MIYSLSMHKHTTLATKLLLTGRFSFSGLTCLWLTRVKVCFRLQMLKESISYSKRMELI